MFTVLIMVGGLAGVVLAGSYKLTTPLIEKHKLEELQQSIFVVLPDATSYEEISTGELQAYKGLNESNEPVGYAFVANGPGFQGPIRMIVGTSPDIQTLLGMRVLEQAETPGLGAKITEENFGKQFSGLVPEWPDTLSAATQGEQEGSAETTPAVQAIPEFITYIKNMAPDEPNEIQAITGATISSVAVVNIINQHLYMLWDAIAHEQSKGE
jgi:electron transport complex protein RnfG